MKTPPSEAAERRRVLLGTLVACACLFALAEAGARRWFPAREATLGEYYDQYLLEAWGPFFRTESGSGSARLIQVPRLDAAEPQEIPLSKPSTTGRIIVVGESNAHMLGQALSRAVRGSRDVEIVNMGIGAADLEAVERRFDEALQYSPDAIVVYFGSNLYYRHPPWTPTLERNLRLSLSMRPVRLLGGVGRLLRRGAAFHIDQRNEPRLDVLDHFLASAAGKARSRGIELVVCGVPSNLWFAPQPQNEQTREYFAVRYLRHTGRMREAIRALRRLATDSSPAQWHFTLAVWHYQIGDYEEASRRFALARDMDPSPDRAAGELNARIERAAAREGFLYADLPKLAAKGAPHGIPGWETFQDQMHLLPDGLDAAAAECLRLLRRAPPGIHARPKPPPVDFGTALTRAMSMMGARNRVNLIYLAGSRLKMWSSGDEAAIATGVPDARERALVLSYVADAFWNAGRRDEAWRLNHEARSLTADLYEPCLQTALFHLEAGESGAAREWLARAAAIDPRRGDAAYFLNAVRKGS